MSSPAKLPSGTVTFLFTDIEGSTRLLKELGGRYGEVLAVHRQLLRRAFEQHGGQEFGTEGDALFIAFRRARDAVSAAAAGQLALAEQDWPGGVEVRVRMGLHTGEPVVGEEGYVGLGLHKAARISSAGHGGQVLLSSTTRELVADDLAEALGLRDLGEHRLRDLDRPERIFELQYPGMATGFAPIETLGVQPVGARVRAPSLVGREEELAAVESSLAAARSGTGTMLLVEGPAGIGKTSLLRAARERAAERGMTVLHARATELERDYPMGVARQALEPAIRSGQDRDRLLRGAAKLAGPILLDVSDPLEATPVGILHGLYWLIANLADEAPVLLAVDDAHWADEPSLRFLAYLARRVEDLPVALLIGSRGEEGAGADAALAEMRVEAVGRRVEPPALDAAGVERLLRELEAGPVDDGFARVCHEATGGNPFLLGELVRALRADDVPFTAAGAARVTEVTPPTVARATAATLTRLGPRATALARAAAVLGDGVTLEFAAELAQVPISDAASAAADLARAGTFDDELLLRFRHPILTGAVRAGMPTRARAGAHARAAELLRRQGATPDRVALQLLHASPAGDERAVADLRLAAEHATERGAPATAAVLLRRALAEPAVPELRGDLLVELSRAELATGRTTQAAERLEEAYACAADPLARGRAVAAMAQVTPGEPAARRRLVELVERTLGEVGGRDRELALRLRAVVVLERGSFEGLALEGTTPGEAFVLGHLVFARMRPDATAAEIADIAERAARRAEDLLEDGASSLAFTGSTV
jgi:class 3 adenylate cyclase